MCEMFRFSKYLALAAFLLIGFGSVLRAQPFAGPNIDMICGSGDVKKCDPSLSKQNEPTIAVSTRNPNTLIAGANDYRGTTVGGDSWVSVIKSFDGGLTWTSSLHPGCPEIGQIGRAHG